LDRIWINGFFHNAFPLPKKNPIGMMAVLWALSGFAKLQKYIIATNVLSHRKTIEEI
jgi:hypothetical protein